MAAKKLILRLKKTDFTANKIGFKGLKVKSKKLQP